MDLPTKMDLFKLKQFDILQEENVMKVGTDGLLLGAWVAVENRVNALDIGTGSGIIPLMLAQRNTALKIVGIDIDAPSATLARKNFEASKFHQQLTSSAQALQEYEPKVQFDLIVTNPPFFSGGTLSESSDRNRMRQTTKLSHQDLLSNVQRLLTNDGDFSLVLPPIEGLRFIEMASYFKLYCHKITEIFPRANQPVKRMLMSFAKIAPTNIVKNNLTIDLGARNVWTDEYIQLTKDYHINL